MGVLLQLYMKNNFFCCCWCNSDDDRNASQAVRSIQRSCRYNVQYPLVLHSNNNNNSNSGTAGSNTNFLQNLFGTLSNATTSQQHQQEGPILPSPRRVRMVLQDSDMDGQPIITIIPVPTSTTEHGESETIQIKLRRIDKVHLDGDQIVMYSKASSGTGSSGSRKKGRESTELLRFAVLSQQNDPTLNDDHNNEATGSSSVTDPNMQQLVSSDTRNMIVHHWMVLVEWERQRRIKLYAAAKKNNNNDSNNRNNDSDSEDDDDDTNNNKNSHGNFITRHAQKVRHYAEREMELQTTKRQREIRKSQYLAQTGGGMKYTALALSQQQQQNGK